LAGNAVNAFCEITHEFSIQKEVSETCQNNFECVTNQCSGSVCVGLVEEIRAQTGILNRIWCGITNLFDDEGYIQCLDQ